MGLGVGIGVRLGVRVGIRVRVGVGARVMVMVAFRIRVRVTLVAMVGPMARRRPLPKASHVNISLTGTAKPTDAAKKKRTIHLTTRFIWLFQICCERGTLTKHMPATKAPSRCDPMKAPPSAASLIAVMYAQTERVATIRKMCTSSRGCTWWVREGTTRIVGALCDAACATAPPGGPVGGGWWAAWPLASAAL